MLDGGSIWDMEKRLPQGLLTLPVTPGFCVGSLFEAPDQDLGALKLNGVSNFGQLSAITASEILRDLQSLFNEE